MRLKPSSVAAELSQAETSRISPLILADVTWL